MAFGDRAKVFAVAAADGISDGSVTHLNLSLFLLSLRRFRIAGLLIFRTTLFISGGETDLSSIDATAAVAMVNAGDSDWVY